MSKYTPYLVLYLKWAITLLLAYAILITTENAYISLAIIWIMVWQQLHAYTLGATILLYDKQDSEIKGLITIAEGQWKITEMILDAFKACRPDDSGESKDEGGMRQ